MFADDVALYYTDGFGINRRMHNNVGTELPTVTLADGITSLVTDPETNRLFWLTNTGKLMVSNRQGPVSDGFPVVINLPTTTRNMVIGGGRLYWFAGSTLYSLDKNCPIRPQLYATGAGQRERRQPAVSRPYQRRTPIAISVLGRRPAHSGV